MALSTKNWTDCNDELLGIVRVLPAIPETNDGRELLHFELERLE